MVSIVLGAALGTVAEGMADARKYLEEKKAGLENLYLASGFDSRKKLAEKRAKKQAKSGNIKGKEKEQDQSIPLDQVITLDHLTNPDKK